MEFFESFKGGRLGVLGLTLAAAVSLAASSAYAGAGKEWPVSRGDLAGTGYSTLDQVNTGNVSNLKVKWMHSMGSVLSQETAPLIIDGVMYFSTSSGPAYVFAVNAETGETIWAHQPDMPNDYHAVVCCGEANRGVTYANGRIFFGRDHCPALYHDLEQCAICSWTATRKRIQEENSRNQALKNKRRKK